MLRAMIPPIFRSTRLRVTACGIMHPRCCRPVVWNLRKTQSSAPEVGRDNRPKHVELNGIINKLLLLHLVGVYIIQSTDMCSGCKPTTLLLGDRVNCYNTAKWGRSSQIVPYAYFIYVKTRAALQQSCWWLFPAINSQLRCDKLSFLFPLVEYWHPPVYIMGPSVKVRVFD